jgi:hypothetical protein
MIQRKRISFGRRGSRPAWCWAVWRCQCVSVYRTDWLRFSSASPPRAASRPASAWSIRGAFAIRTRTAWPPKHARGTDAWRVGPTPAPSPMRPQPMRGPATQASGTPDTRTPGGSTAAHQMARCVPRSVRRVRFETSRAVSAARRCRFVRTNASGTVGRARARGPVPPGKRSPARTAGRKCVPSSAPGGPVPARPARGHRFVSTGVAVRLLARRAGPGSAMAVAGPAHALATRQRVLMDVVPVRAASQAPGQMLADSTAAPARSAVLNRPATSRSAALRIAPGNAAGSPMAAAELARVACACPARLRVAVTAGPALSRARAAAPGGLVPAEGFANRGRRKWQRAGTAEWNFRTAMHSASGFPACVPVKALAAPARRRSSRAAIAAPRRTRARRAAPGTAVRAPTKAPAPPMLRRLAATAIRAWRHARHLAPGARAWAEAPAHPAPTKHAVTAAPELKPAALIARGERAAVGAPVHPVPQKRATPTAPRLVGATAPGEPVLAPAAQLASQERVRVAHSRRAAPPARSASELARSVALPVPRRVQRPPAPGALVRVRAVWSRLAPVADSSIARSRAMIPGNTESP